MLVLCSCGKKDEAQPVFSVQITESKDSNFIGGRCGDHVLSDYRELSSRCRKMKTREEASACKQLSQEFLRRYPAVNCTAAEKNERNGQVQERKIEAKEIEALIERLNRIGV